VRNESEIRIEGQSYRLTVDCVEITRFTLAGASGVPNPLGEQPAQ
jgi:hypothetical protein